MQKAPYDKIDFSRQHYTDLRGHLPLDNRGRRIENKQPEVDYKIDTTTDVLLKQEDKDYKLLYKDGFFIGFWVRSYGYWIQDSSKEGELKNLHLRALAVKHKLPVEIFKEIINIKYQILYANGQEPVTLENIERDKGGYLILLESPVKVPDVDQEQSVTMAKKPWWRFWR
jgi:hypothetical protein